MNKGLTFSIRSNFSYVIPVIKPKVNLITVNDINPYWFFGFTDA